MISAVDLNFDSVFLRQTKPSHAFVFTLVKKDFFPKKLYKQNVLFYNVKEIFLIYGRKIQCLKKNK